jgi:DNA-binding transcriptional MerR regulator
MSWSIAQVARISTVTSRTLRHYDEIGLLKPARVGGNGYRYYEREQLLRLQQILLLRDLGLGLTQIGQVLDKGERPVDALRSHLQHLLAERDRLATLARTVSCTIADLEGGEFEMKAEELFDGFDAAKQARYEAELVERYGEDVREHIDESKRRIAGWTKADAAEIERLYGAAEADLVRMIEAGATADDPRVQEIIGRHFQVVSRFWTPNRESYTGLGQLYVDSPDFKARYDAQHPELAEFMRDAMAVYARTRLS